MKPEDFKRLAGPWRGTSNVQGEVSQNVEGVIYENGSFYIVQRRSPGNQMPGQMDEGR